MYSILKECFDIDAINYPRKCEGFWCFLNIAYQTRNLASIENMWQSWRKKIHLKNCFLQNISRFNEFVKQFDSISWNIFHVLFALNILFKIFQFIISFLILKNSMTFFVWMFKSFLFLIETWRINSVALFYNRLHFPSK